MTSTDSKDPKLDATREEATKISVGYIRRRGGTRNFQVQSNYTADDDHHAHLSGACRDCSAKSPWRQVHPACPPWVHRGPPCTWPTHNQRETTDKKDRQREPSQVKSSLAETRRDEARRGEARQGEARRTCRTRSSRRAQTGPGMREEGNF